MRRLPGGFHDRDRADAEVERRAVDRLATEARVDEELGGAVARVLGIALGRRRLGLERAPFAALLVPLEQELRLHAVEVEHQHAVLAGDPQVAGVGPRPRLVALAAERPDHAVGETERHLNVQVDAVLEQVGAREDVLRLVRDEPEPEPEQVRRAGRSR